MTEDISSIILAGGKSRRLGKDKAGIKLDGKTTILQDIVDKLLKISGEVIVSTDGRRYEGLDKRVKWADDIYPGGGSLVGLYSGLKEAKFDYALVVACDMPFLNIDLIRYMIAMPRDYDVLISRIDGKPQPLHAIYSKNCLKAMRELLEADRLSIMNLYPKVNTKYLPQEIIDRYDAEHRSFLDVNSPEKLEKARIILENNKK